MSLIGTSSLWHGGRVPTKPVLVQGPRYLDLATRLLQRLRLENPVGGIWEAADVQWWHRQERPIDHPGQLFWFDAEDLPAAAVLWTDFGGMVQCDVLVRPGDEALTAQAWPMAISHANGATEFVTRGDDEQAAGLLLGAGFRPEDGHGGASSWMEATRRPEVPGLPDGYRLVSRADDNSQPHWLAARNGPAVERRLAECSLYRPDLDLAVRAPDGTVAGYGLFWPDPITSVGLVEPMRTEETHARQGLASHLLAEGLRRLAVSGCQRLKVSNDIGLYLRAGFQPDEVRVVAWSRPAA
jgi:GNAT superfamily N-acetyltransferase